MGILFFFTKFFVFFFEEMATKFLTDGECDESDESDGELVSFHELCGIQEGASLASAIVYDENCEFHCPQYYDFRSQMPNTW